MYMVLHLRRWNWARVIIKIQTQRQAGLRRPDPVMLGQGMLRPGMLRLGMHG
jgi:hypothetical protein